MSTKKTATSSTFGTILALGAVAIAAVVVDRNRDKLAPMGAKVADSTKTVGTMIAANAKTVWASVQTFAKKMADGSLVYPDTKPAAVRQTGAPANQAEPEPKAA